MNLRNLTFSISLLLCFSLIQCGGGEESSSKLSSLYTFSGGPSGGTFQYYASAISTIGQNNGHKILARSSGGSIENIRLVNSGKSDFAVAYSGHVYAGANGKLKNDPNLYENVSVLAYLYGAPAQLVVTESSGINDPRDLAGKRVGVGNAGSGAAANAEIFFSQIGVWEEMNREYLGYRNAATAMQNGQLDAFWVFTGYPSASILEVALQEDIKLLDTYAAGVESGLFDEHPFFTPVTIPENVYSGQTEAVSSFQDGALLVANDKVADDMVIKLLNLIYDPEGLAYMVSVHKSAAAMSVKNGLDGVVTKVHPAAVKFWRERGLALPDHVE